MRSYIRLAAGLALCAACTEDQAASPAGQGGSVTNPATGSGGMNSVCAGAAGVPVSGSGGSSSGGAPGSGGNGTAGTVVAAGGNGGSAAVDAGPVASMPSAGCNKSCDRDSRDVRQALVHVVRHQPRLLHLPSHGLRLEETLQDDLRVSRLWRLGQPSANIPIQNESKQDAIIIAPQSKGPATKTRSATRRT